VLVTTLSVTSNKSMLRRNTMNTEIGNYC
jgi:hypothetical protein